MSLTNQIEVFNIAIKKLNDNINELQAEASLLSVERNKLIIDMITEEKLLDGSEWILDKQGTSIEATTDSLALLRKKINPQDYLFLEFNEGIQVSIDGLYAYIDFTEPRELVAFARKHGCKIDGGQIANKLSALKRQIIGLETLSHQFNLSKK